MEYRQHHPERFVSHLLAAPFIYSMIFPLLFLDLCVEIYQHICFPLYRIPIVQRSQYIKLDRQKLAYLWWIDKVNCMYCGYANGLVHFATVIAAETEKYWCGIQHEKDLNFIPPKHHENFLPYGDEKAFNNLVSREKK